MKSKIPAFSKLMGGSFHGQVKVILMTEVDLGDRWPQTQPLKSHGHCRIPNFLADAIGRRSSSSLTDISRWIPASLRSFRTSQRPLPTPVTTTLPPTLPPFSRFRVQRSSKIFETVTLCVQVAPIHSPAWAVIKCCDIDAQSIVRPCTGTSTFQHRKDRLPVGPKRSSSPFNK